MNSPFDKNTMNLQDKKYINEQAQTRFRWELESKQPLENLQDKTEITWLSYDLYSEARPLSRQG